MFKSLAKNESEKANEHTAIRSKFVVLISTRHSVHQPVCHWGKKNNTCYKLDASYIQFVNCITVFIVKCMSVMKQKYGCHIYSEV